MGLRGCKGCCRSWGDEFADFPRAYELSKLRACVRVRIVSEEERANAAARAGAGLLWAGFVASCEVGGGSGACGAVDVVVEQVWRREGQAT